MFEKFEFGENIIKWVKCFYSNKESKVMNKGYSTGWFKLGKGVRQGCPLSVIMFVLSVELLAENIHRDQNIEGIKINDCEIKVGQFADDTTGLVSNLTSVERFLVVLEMFSNVSGLKVNRQKTIATWIGKKRGCKFKPLNLEWSNDPVRVLGIHLSYQYKNNNSLNFTQKLRNIQKTFYQFRVCVI